MENKKFIYYFKQFPEGNVCKLHDGTTAICKRMEQCQWLIKGIETKILTFSDIRGCGFIVSTMQKAKREKKLLFLQFL